MAEKWDISTKPPKNICPERYCWFWSGTVRREGKWCELNKYRELGDKVMDSIKAVSSTSPYIAMEHLNIYVNGKRLDEIIAEHTDPSYIGLIPAWLDFYDEDFAPTQKEKQYVWEQTHLTEKAKILPILLCPDDFDFSCTVVVVEVFEEGDNVRWNRFGVDVTEFDPNEAVLPKYIGRKVEWFSSLSACTFLKSEYLECIHAFSSTSLRNIDNSLG